MQDDPGAEAGLEDKWRSSTSLKGTAQGPSNRREVELTRWTPPALGHH